jgi:hypothetical protein
MNAKGKKNQNQNKNKKIFINFILINYFNYYFSNSEFLEIFKSTKKNLEEGVKYYK